LLRLHAAQISVQVFVSTQEKIYAEVSRYFENTLQKFGATPNGVDWNGDVSQELRFRQFLRCLPNELVGSESTITDFGCGYGAFLSYLRNQEMRCGYLGIDCVQEMIDEALNLHGKSENCDFVCAKELSKQTDFVIASGVFNARFDFTNERWIEYVISVLKNFDQNSRKAFVFNLLTSYSDADKMRPDLFYADPSFFFDYCKRNFSKNVALLHDYGAYEFTIVVRK